MQLNEEHNSHVQDHDKTFLVLTQGDLVVSHSVKSTSIRSHRIIQLLCPTRSELQKKVVETETEKTFHHSRINIVVTRMILLQ